MNTAGIPDGLCKRGRSTVYLGEDGDPGGTPEREVCARPWWLLYVGLRTELTAAGAGKEGEVGVVLLSVRRG